MKKVILLILFLFLLSSCESGSESSSKIEEIPFSIIGTTSYNIEYEWECPDNIKIIYEGTDSGGKYLYFKTNKLTKDGDVMKIKYRCYYSEAYAENPQGWTDYIETEILYYQQSMNLHWYRFILTHMFQPYRRVVEVTGEVEAEDGTKCDIGNFRMGSATYINL